MNDDEPVYLPKPRKGGKPSFLCTEFWPSHEKGVKRSAQARRVLKRPKPRTLERLA